MSDEGEESDSGERPRLSESSAPPLSVCLPRGSPTSQRPLNIFSSASPLLGDTDPPYLTSPECLHPSIENREAGDSFTPPKLRQRIGDSGSPFRSQPDVRIDTVHDCYDDPFPKWRGRGAADAERFQHRGQRLNRAPELLDYENHCSVEHIDTELNRQT